MSRPAPAEIALLAAIIGGPRRAARHAPMLPPGDTRGKYHTVNVALRDGQLAAHLAGRATYAAVLIGRDGLAGAGVVELDHGGAETAGRVRAAASALGVHMFSIIARGAGSHDGSHSWALFAERTEPERIQALMRAIVAAAGLPETTETWPNGCAIRLPFGVHTHTGRRGRYADTAGVDLDLDDCAGLAAGLAAILTLPPNPLPPAAPEPPAPEPPMSEPLVAATLPVARQGGGVRELIAAFNREHPAEQLLAGYGAARTRGGWACSCGLTHSHATQLAVTTGGRLVFFSSRCGWAPPRVDRHGRRVGDSFDLFVAVEHRGDKAAALRALRAASPRERFPTPPADGDRRQTDAAQTEARWRDAERKRASRRSTAAETLQAVRDRAAEDVALSPCDRAVLRALLEVAGERGWCRPSKMRLAELSGYALGSVKRALMRLEARGYFASQGDGGRSGDTAIRTFLRGSSVEVEGGRSYVDHSAAPVIPESIGESDPIGLPWAGEGGGDEACWAALMEACGDAPALSDPAAIAAWEVPGGLCAVPAGELPEGDDEAAAAADEARILAYRERRAAPAEPEPRVERVAFAGGASFDPAGGQVEPFDLAAHWARLAEASPAALAAAPDLVLVPRAEVDPAHARRIRELTGRAHACRALAQSSPTWAQRRWARAEAGRLLGQAQALRAEEVQVSPELLRRGSARAAPEARAATGGRAAPSPAPGFIQADLFSYGPPGATGPPAG